MRRASVLVDAEDPHAVELGQLGQKDAEQGGRVDDEVRGVVFGVKAGEEVPGREREAPGELRAAPTLPSTRTGGILGASLVLPLQNGTSQLGNPLQPQDLSVPGRLCQQKPSGPAVRPRHPPEPPPPCPPASFSGTHSTTGEMLRNLREEVHCVP